MSSPTLCNTCFTWGQVKVTSVLQNMCNYLTIKKEAIRWSSGGHQFLPVKLEILCGIFRPKMDVLGRGVGWVNEQIIII